MILQTRLLAMELSYRYRDRTTSSIDISETNIHQDRLGTKRSEYSNRTVFVQREPWPTEGNRPSTTAFLEAVKSCSSLVRVA